MSKEFPSVLSVIDDAKSPSVDFRAPYATPQLISIDAKNTNQSTNSSNDSNGSSTGS